MPDSLSLASFVDEAGEGPDWEWRLREVIAKLPRSTISSLSSEEVREMLTLYTRVARFGGGRHGPVVSLMAHIGNYWRSVILLLLRTGPRRTGQLRAMVNAGIDSTPLSQRMMTLSLRVLERDGLIERVVSGENSIRVQYRLTDLGKELSEMMVRITEWGSRNVDVILRSREAFDAKD